jgi:hypothetical protein
MLVLKFVSTCFLLSDSKWHMQLCIVFCNCGGRLKNTLCLFRGFLTCSLPGVQQVLSGVDVVTNLKAYLYRMFLLSCSWPRNLLRELDGLWSLQLVGVFFYPVFQFAMSRRRVSSCSKYRADAGILSDVAAMFRDAISWTPCVFFSPDL